jgi:hypothetical protein
MSYQNRGIVSPIGIPCCTPDSHARELINTDGVTDYDLESAAPQEIGYFGGFRSALEFLAAGYPGPAPVPLQTTGLNAPPVSSHQGEFFFSRRIGHATMRPRFRQRRQPWAACLALRQKVNAPLIFSTAPIIIRTWAPAAADSPCWMGAASRGTFTTSAMPNSAPSSSTMFKKCTGRAA